MTVRQFGRNERAMRPSLAALAMTLALGAGAAPLSAQQSETPAPTPAPAPAPTPAPSSTFRLPPADDGRASGVQGPSDNGLPPLAPGERRGLPTPAPTPRIVPPAVVPTRSADTAQASPERPAATRREAPATTTSRAAPENGGQTDAAAARGRQEASVPDSPVSASASPPAPSTAALAAPADDSAEPAPVRSVAPGEGGTPWWAWVLAGLAAAVAGFWYWRRRPLAVADAPAELVESPPVAPVAPAPRAATPQRASVPPPPASPVPAAPVASPLVTRPAAERRANVSMALDIRGIRLTNEQLIVAFSLNLLNQGLVAATGMMVRIALNQGSAMPEVVLARFFDGAGGSVLRDDMTLAPGAGEQLSTEVMLPRAAVDPLMIAGKPMLVPVLAIDVTYHWDGEGDAFGQNAGTFVLGREQGVSGSEKIAPLPLDHPNLVVNRPGARTTTVRRIQ